MERLITAHGPHGIGTFYDSKFWNQWAGELSEFGLLSGFMIARVPSISCLPASSGRNPNQLTAPFRRFPLIGQKRMTLAPTPQLDEESPRCPAASKLVGCMKNRPNGDTGICCLKPTAVKN